MRIEPIICSALTTIVNQCPFTKNPSRNTPTYGGLNIGFAKIPAFIKNAGNVPKIVPPITYGKKNVGFNTIGAPQ